MHFHRNIPLMYAIACMQGMVFYGSIATLYRQAAGISVFQIALIESLSLVLGLLLELPWGMIADRIGYRRTMIACCWIYLASKLVFWRATDFAGFLAERVLLSVALAGISGVDTSILYLSCAPGQSQRAFGVYNNLMTGGLLLSAGIYARFLRDADRLSALLTCISYAVAAILSLFLKEVRPEDTKERIRPRVFLSLLKKVCRDAPLLCMLTGAALLNETHQIITVFFN